MTRPVHYGDTYEDGILAHRGTIHDSGTIDIEQDPETGEVTAVWFRCLFLPFQTFTRASVARCNPADEGAVITAIEYLEGETA